MGWVKHSGFGPPKNFLAMPLQQKCSYTQTTLVLQIPYWSFAPKLQWELLSPRPTYFICQP